MKKILLSALFFALAASSAELRFVSGFVGAHTSVFGDHTIDPKSEKLQSSLTMDGDIESIKGSVAIDALSLVSDDAKRDEHMYGTLDAEKFPKINYTIQAVKKEGAGYDILGTLDLHGVQKEVHFKSSIEESSGKVKMRGESAIKMSDFSITPPTLLFLTVRDDVNLTFDAEFSAE